MPVASNNSTAVAYKQNGGTVYRNISPLTKTLLMSAREYNSIVHRFIPGSMNDIMGSVRDEINVPSCDTSRAIAHGLWCL